MSPTICPRFLPSESFEATEQTGKAPGEPDGLPDMRRQTGDSTENKAARFFITEKFRVLNSFIQSTGGRRRAAQRWNSKNQQSFH